MSAHQTLLSSVTSAADVCQATNTQQSFHHKWENVSFIKALFLGQQCRRTAGFTFTKEGPYDFSPKNAAVNKGFMTQGDFVTRDGPHCGLILQLRAVSCCRDGGDCEMVERW